MAITFDIASPLVHTLVQQVIDRREPDLKEAKLSYQVKLAFNDGNPAVKVNGYARAGKIKINSYEKRVEGLPDVTITLDDEAWKDLKPRQQEALIAHLLHCLKVVRDKEKRIVEDDCGRPKLKMRLHDFHVDVFKTVLDEYREDSPDHGLAMPLVEYMQKTFSFWG